MKIVVTGFDARAARVTPGASKFSMGYLIGEAFVAAGHQVDVLTCWPSWMECLATLDEADAIFVGLASPLGLSSTYTYTALGVLAEFWNDDRLRLFIDDPDTKKIVHGAASAVRRQRSVDPLFNNAAFRVRPALDEAEQRAETMYDVCDWLTEPESWPRVLVPVQCRWLDSRVTKIAASERNAMGVDLTRVAYEALPRPTDDFTDQTGHTGAWVIEAHRAGRWAARIQVAGARMDAPRTTMSIRYWIYRTAHGVLESPAVLSDVSGWWTPYATLAARVGTFYATRLSAAHLPGIQDSAYYVLPDVFGSLPPGARQDVVRQQCAELLASAPDVDQVVEDLLR